MIENYIKGMVFYEKDDDKGVGSYAYSLHVAFA